MKHLILLLLALAGCASCGMPGEESDLADESTPYVAYDPYLLPLMNKFVEEMDSRGVWASHLRLPPAVKFETLPEGTIGICYWIDRQVRIDPMLRLREAELRSVVYHELTHCTYRIHGHELEPDHIMSAESTGVEMSWTPEDWELELDRLAHYVAEYSPIVDVEFAPLPEED